MLNFTNHPSIMHTYKNCINFSIIQLLIFILTAFYIFLQMLTVSYISLKLIYSSYSFLQLLIASYSPLYFFITYSCILLRIEQGLKWVWNFHCTTLSITVLRIPLTYKKCSYFQVDFNCEIKRSESIHQFVELVQLLIASKLPCVSYSMQHNTLIFYSVFNNLLNNLIFNNYK